MDDLAGEGDPAIAEQLRRLVEAGRHRWHAAPGDGSLFVLDDGTGDVELRLHRSGDVLQAALARLDREVERIELPLPAGRLRDEDVETFGSRLDEAVERHVPGPAGEGGKNRTRFIVSFEAAQLAGLRDAAGREGVPVAEVVRRAVDAYLAARGG